jgi:hypothetical protein
MFAWALLTVVLNVAADQAPKTTVALMPLRAGPTSGLASDTGEAWAPLLMELIAERGHKAIYPPSEKVDKDTASRIRGCRMLPCYQDISAAFGAKKLIAGEISREADAYTVTLTLHDLMTFTEENRVERKFVGKRQLDEELRDALTAVFSQKPVVAELPRKIEPAPVSTLSAKSPPATKLYRYRGAAITLTTLGVIGLVGGGGLLAASFILKPVYERGATAYNQAPVRTEDAYAQLVSNKRTLDSVYTGSFIALGVGAAALTMGIVFFAVDGKPDPMVTFMPTGPGGVATVRF